MMAMTRGRGSISMALARLIATGVTTTATALLVTSSVRIDVRA